MKVEEEREIEGEAFVTAMELYGKLPPVVCPLHCSYHYYCCYYFFFEGIELDWQLGYSNLPRGQALLLMRKETGK